MRDGDFDVWLFCPFTREWCVDRFFDALSASDVPFDRCRATFYVDSDSKALFDNVALKAQAIPFASVEVHFTAWEPPPEVPKTILPRRARHGAMRSAMVGLMPRGVEYVLLLEDDTPPPPDTWALLTDDLEQGFDWVCGFEVGRWSVKCPGIWRITPNGASTAVPGSGLEDVDATGLYLVLTKPDVLASVPWDIFDGGYGHDVSITYRMKLAGYRIGVDWRLKCVHMTQHGDLLCGEWEQLDRLLGKFVLPVVAVPLMEFQKEGPRLRSMAAPDAKTDRRPNPRQRRAIRRKRA